MNEVDCISTISIVNIFSLYNVKQKQKSSLILQKKIRGFSKFS